MATFYNRSDFARLMSQIADNANDAALATSAYGTPYDGPTFTNRDKGVRISGMSSGKDSRTGMQLPYRPSSTGTSTAQPDLMQNLYDQGYFDNSSAVGATVTPDLMQNLYDQGYFDTLSQPVDFGDPNTPGFSAAGFSSTADLSDAIPPNTTPGFSSADFLTDMTAVNPSSTLANTGFSLPSSSFPALGTPIETLSLTPSIPSGSDIEEVLVTGQNPNTNAMSGPALNAGAVDIGQRQPDPEAGGFEEILTTGKKKAAEVLGLAPFIGLGSSAYDFIKDLPPGEFTPEEGAALGAVGGAGGVLGPNLPPATSPADPGTGTPVPTPRPVGTPGPGNMGSVGRPRGFVTRDDVLVPSTGPMGNIYSIRPDDTRGRFAAPEFRDPYGGLMYPLPVQPVQTPTVTTSPATTPVEGPMSPSSPVTESSRLAPSETMSLTPRAETQQSPQQILDAVDASDGFQAPEIQSVADLITSGQAGVGAVANQFNVGGNDVIEGLLRGGFQTPAQTAAMLSEQSGNDISEINLIIDLLNQGNTTPAEVAAYYSNLQRNDPTAYAQYGDLTNFSAQDVQTELDRINQQRNAPLMAAAQGGVVEKSEGIESLLDRRQQAVNRRLARQAAGQFNQGGAAVSTEKKSLTPTNFQSGGLANKFVAKGAELLGFGDDRQLEITKEAVDLTNYMVDNGLIGEQSRIKLTLPQPGEAPTRTNTGIEGDEEVLNAVTHALFSYYAAEAGTLPRMGAQLKEILQSREVAKKGGDPSTEALDYFNNPFGFNLSDQGLTPPEAKMAIVDNLVGVDNQGARYRMAQGLQPRSGFELLTNREDVPKPDYKPAFSARDALYSGQAQGLAKGGPPLQANTGKDDEGLAQLYDTINRITEDVEARNAAENRAKIVPLQTRLEQATPLERHIYEKYRLEPGLDRATFLPLATRQSGENELAFPGPGYSAMKGVASALAALRGVPSTPEEAMELALSATSGGLLTSNVDTGADILMGMAAKPKGGVFPPLNRRIDPNNPDAYELYGADTPLDLEALFGRTGAESLPAAYQAKLIEAGVDEELAQSIAGRAENYFKKSFGTNSDEIRTKILQGKINPSDASIDDSQARLLREAREDFATGLGKEPYFDLTRAYDRDTGIRLYDEGMPGLRTGERAKMIEEGVPEGLINSPASESLMGRRGFPPLYEDGDLIAASSDIRSRLYPEMLDDPAFMQAIENREPIYDIDTNVLDEGMLQFLSPDNLVEGILTIPRNKLTNMAFPDVVENAQKSQAAEEVQVIRDFSGKHDKLKLKAQENFLNSLTSDSPPRNSRGTFDIPSGFIPAELPPPEFLLKKGVKKIKDFGPDSWFRITKAPFTQLEGALMNHSVGGYAKGNSYNLGGRRALTSGEAGVFSLRDNQTGKPRLTTEISFSNPDRPKPTIGQIKGPSNESIKAEDVDRLFSLWDEVGVLPEDVGTGRMPPSVFDAATYREEYIKFLDEQKTGSGFSGFDV